MTTNAKPDAPTIEILSALCGGSVAAWRAVLAPLRSLRELADGRPVNLPVKVRDRLALVCEIAQRYGEQPWPQGEGFKGSYDVYAAFRERLAVLKFEVFLAILLDNRHSLIRTVEVSRGSLTASIVHPREVYRPVIAEAAAAVIFVHNHPSGDPTPSREDLEITKRLREVGDLLGVKVLDHIIVGAGRYVSFVDDGYW